MKRVIQYIWQLPQNLLGLLVILFSRGKKSCLTGLNKIEFYGTNKKFGPLYLIIIGLPSAIGNLIHRKFKFDYYKQPWEAWADKLGGVKR